MRWRRGRGPVRGHRCSPSSRSTAALMGIKELSAELISALRHPGLLGGGLLLSDPPRGSPLRKSKSEQGHSTWRGLEHLCNKHVHMSLTAKHYKAGLQTACVHLSRSFCRCSVALLYMCAIRLSAGQVCEEGPDETSPLECTERRSSIQFNQSVPMSNLILSN